MTTWEGFYWARDNKNGYGNSTNNGGTKLRTLQLNSQTAIEVASGHTV